MRPNNGIQGVEQQVMLWNEGMRMRYSTPSSFPRVGRIEAGTFQEFHFQELHTLLSPRVRTFEWDFISTVISPLAYFREIWARFLPVFLAMIVEVLAEIRGNTGMFNVHSEASPKGPKQTIYSPRNFFAASYFKKTCMQLAAGVSMPTAKGRVVQAPRKWCRGPEYRNRTGHKKPSSKMWERLKIVSKTQ